MELISQGAEAKIYLVQSYLGEKAVLKERLIKKYRHPDLDQQLTKERMTYEVRNMVRARKSGINTPYVMHVDFEQRKVYMQYIEGIKLRDYIIQNKQNDLTQLLKDLALILAKLHDINIIHGDLTTSNFMVTLNKDNNQYQHIYLIDFGLSFVKDNVEEKAVDLYVLERAFISTHPELEQQFQLLIQEYEQKSRQGNKTIKKLIQVRQRGRKKLAFG